ncbi:hypothetical protein AC579_5826 [Pseudocercospora musae]|uniref:Uncharacterized protein n=1 Tax=Pseudocercospora musae TaxID=113226 RepID=A0A139I3B1_9PEZI|nr:hypothetical protein AC579_5826 [Pseudocercospora musae]
MARRLCKSAASAANPSRDRPVYSRGILFWQMPITRGGSSISRISVGWEEHQGHAGILGRQEEHAIVASQVQPLISVAMVKPSPDNGVKSGEAVPWKDGTEILSLPVAFIGNARRARKDGDVIGFNGCGATAHTLLFCEWDFGQANYSKSGIFGFGGGTSRSGAAVVLVFEERLGEAQARAELKPEAERDARCITQKDEDIPDVQLPSVYTLPYLIEVPSSTSQMAVLIIAVTLLHTAYGDRVAAGRQVDNSPCYLYLPSAQHPGLA